jgi:hypothetical protein
MARRTDHDGGSGVHPGPAVATGEDRPALARVVGDVEEFARTAWGREPLLRKAADAASFGDLLSEAAVDELVSERGRRTPFLRVAKDGATVANRDFTAPGGVGAGVADQVSDDKLTALFAGGSTLVLQGLHRVWPPVVELCQQLAADLGHPVQANAYVTPPQSRGFDNHYDVHDVFVLQVAGRKRWTVHAPVHPLPLRDQPWTDRRDAVARAAAAEPVIDTVLEPGDVLYLSRGYLHSATATGGVTVHLTLGLHTWTRHAVADELAALLLERLADDEDLRASLPIGTDLGPDELDADLVASRLRALVDELDPADLSERLRARRRSTQRAAPIGPLAQHRLAASLDETTTLRLRPYVDARRQGDRLTSRAGTVEIRDASEEAVRRLLDEEPVSVGELGAGFARALVEAGVVVRA